MNDIKACQRGLKLKSDLFGFEALDIILLAPGFYLASVVAGSLPLALLITATTGVSLRIGKLGHLPGHTRALFHFLTRPQVRTCFPIEAGFTYPKRTP